MLVAGARRWALVHELRDEAEPSLADVVGRFADCDLLLVEGFKRNPHRKLEIHRPEIGKPLLCTGDPTVIAVATTATDLDVPVPVLALDDIDGIADFILAHL